VNPITPTVARTFVVTLVANPESAGTLSSFPNHANPNKTVMLSQTPSDCYEFNGWTSEEDVTVDNNNNSFVMPAKDVIITANYVPKQYTITATNTLYGTIVGTGTYSCGSTATLIATASTGYQFAGWYENDNLITTTPTYSFIINSDRMIKAKFNSNNTITIAEDTQTDFLTGTLSNVTAINNELALSTNYALSFDGVNDYIYVPQINNTTFGSQFTIEMDIKTGPSVTTQYLFSISRTKSDVTNEAVLQLVPSGSGWVLRFWDYSTAYGFPESSGSNTLLQPNQKYHLAFVKNGVNGTYYVNGNFSGSITAARDVHYGNDNAYFGSNYRDNNVYFNGSIDEVRIWNVARSQSDIQSNMNRQLNGTEPGLVGYWKLDENSGTTIYDSTPNHSNGTIYGAQWVSNGYQLFGTRTSPIYNIASIGAVASSTISWTAVTPIDTSVTVETRISLDGGNTWSEWQQCTNGGAVPGLPVGTDLSNARIQIQQTLSTSNADVTPQLDKVVIQITPSE